MSKAVKAVLKDWSAKLFRGLLAGALIGLAACVNALVKQAIQGDLGTVVGSLLFSVGLIASVVSLMLSVALYLVSQAFKLTVFNGVVPAMVGDKLKLGAALKKAFAFKKERFWPLFSTYVVTAMFILCLNVLFALSSFGAALLLTVPMSYMMLICIQFVSSYTYDRKKYFLNKDTVVKPEKQDDSGENFYEDFEL